MWGAGGAVSSFDARCAVQRAIPAFENAVLSRLGKITGEEESQGAPAAAKRGHTAERDTKQSAHKSAHIGQQMCYSQTGPPACTGRNLNPRTNSTQAEGEKRKAP